MTDAVNGFCSAGADGDFSDETVGGWKGGKRERDVAMVDTLACPIPEGVCNFYEDRVNVSWGFRRLPFVSDFQRQPALLEMMCFTRTHQYI